MFYTSLTNNNSLLNNMKVIQQPFIFLVGKMSYDVIYYNKSSQTKIITAIMCFLGATKLIELFTENCPQIEFKYLLYDNNINNSDNDNSNEEITDEEVQQLSAFNERSDVSSVTNDVDRLNEQITELCENK